MHAKESEKRNPCRKDENKMIKVNNNNSVGRDFAHTLEVQGGLHLINAKFHQTNLKQFRGLIMSEGDFHGSRAVEKSAKPFRSRKCNLNLPRYPFNPTTSVIYIMLMEI